MFLTRHAPPAPPAEAGGNRGWRRLVAIPGGQAPRAAETVPIVSAPVLGTIPAVRHRRWRREIADARSVFLEIPGIKPVMQMAIKFGLKAADGTELRSEVINTIHALGD